eukprot:2273837-Amphidinium_carterae.1
MQSFLFGLYAVIGFGPQKGSDVFVSSHQINHVTSEESLMRARLADECTQQKPCTLWSRPMRQCPSGQPAAVETGGVR